jgi:hypothetical protein
MIEEIFSFLVEFIFEFFRRKAIFFISPLWFNRLSEKHNNLIIGCQANSKKFKKYLHFLM